MSIKPFTKKMLQRKIKCTWSQDKGQRLELSKLYVENAQFQIRSFRVEGCLFDKFTNW